MSTEFYVKIGEIPYGYGQEREYAFESSVFRLGDKISVQFHFNGDRHHTGFLKTTPDIARWLAFALLAAAEGAPDARANSIKVRNDEIIERTVGT